MLGTKITGDRIVLRPLNKADIENRVRWFNDPDVRKTLIVSEQFELGKTIRWFEKIQADDSRVELIIETPQNTAVGVVGLAGIDSTHRTAEIYIVIGQKELWGKGVMLEAECLLIDWAFNSRGLEKIWAEARLDNIASVITMKKIGFQIEGTLRCDKIVDGRRIDVLRLGLLKNEFKDTAGR
ncbi:MAG: GNAT family N-acetyltransferase [Planctomycetes bacterium]|nr:GNAT family N-acetyltransferase [Planctomycetota bacterium]